MPTKKLTNFDIYFITDSSLTKTPVISQVKQALNSGVKILQYREKKLSTLEMYKSAMDIKKLTNGKAIFIINDRIDICLAVDADGVHLGDDDIPYLYARKLLRKKIIGLSTHNLEEALFSEKIGADYISIGPIYPTTTKPKHKSPVGTEIIKEISKKIKIPYVAIGGINETNIEVVLSAGAKNVAMISAILTKKDIKKELRKYQNYFLTLRGIK